MADALKRKFHNWFHALGRSTHARTVLPDAPVSVAVAPLENDPPQHHQVMCRRPIRGSLLIETVP
jgi:hypothetical protein